jgi:hypothetical protein
MHSSGIQLCAKAVVSVWISSAIEFCTPVTSDPLPEQNEDWQVRRSGVSLRRLSKNYQAATAEFE